MRSIRGANPRSAPCHDPAMIPATIPAMLPECGGGQPSQDWPPRGGPPAASGRGTVQSCLAAKRAMSPA